MTKALHVARAHCHSVRFPDLGTVDTGRGFLSCRAIQGQLRGVEQHPWSLPLDARDTHHPAVTTTDILRHHPISLGGKVTTLPFLGLLINSNTIPRRPEPHFSLRSMAPDQGFSALKTQTSGPGCSLWGRPGPHCRVLSSPHPLDARSTFSLPVMTTTNVSMHRSLVSPGGQGHLH